MRTIFCILCFFISVHAAAEPFLAVENGFHCVQCHISPAGGGSRNSYGALFIQTQLPATPAASEDLWTGGFGSRFTLGADVRYALRQTAIDGTDSLQDFTTDRATIYFSVRLNDRTRLYFDQQIAPGGSINRESWVKVDLTESLYLRAGKIFLPYGLRLEDDSAFIRQQTNVNFNTADHGIELGYIRDSISIQGTITNGTGGAAESDRHKQVSLLTAYVRPQWRLGVSMNRNRTSANDRRMGGVFAGFRTGPVAWLIEADRIHDLHPGTADETISVDFAEADVRLKRGHYVRLTAERSRSDLPGSTDVDRLSAEYQLFAMAFTQLRIGARKYRSDNPDPFFSREEWFAQLHLYF